ncbi:MAG TPA: hypothetical protein VFQ38_23545 [Longimicrobiales bacterium]|nr:hypothetical protein [Longimicrobiales bacterium]
MPKVTVHFRDAHGNAKRFDFTADQIDVYETRALAEQLGRQITEQPGGPHSSPVVDDLPAAAVPLAAMAAAGPGTGSGGASASGTMSTMEDSQCILVNGVVICGK